MNKINSNSLRTTIENEFIGRNQFYLALIFIVLWFSYCWWLSEQYHFDFGQYTIILRLLFCIIHVLTVWNFFQYIIKLIFRLYQFSRRLGIVLIDHLIMIIITFVLLTFVLSFKQFLREIFGIIN
jgi:hypothetical protein